MSASVNPLSDRGAPPSEEALRAALGASHSVYLSLLSFVTEELGVPDLQWKWYAGGRGWTGKVLLGSRNLFFVSPRAGAFQLGFVFGDRAVEAASAPPLPAALVEELRAAKKYAEGRGLRVLVSSAEDLDPVFHLIRLKITH